MAYATELWLPCGVGETMKPMTLLRVATVALALSGFFGCSSTQPQEAPVAWRSVNAGMTQQEISQLLGPPTQPSAQGGDVWIKAGWELQIDYDQYGRARNVLSRPISK